MDGRPPRALALGISLLAVLALLVPILYTVERYGSLTGYGRPLAVLVGLVAGFGILTVVLSVLRAFVAPAVQAANDRRKNGNL